MQQKERGCIGKTAQADGHAARSNIHGCGDTLMCIAVGCLFPRLDIKT